MSHIGVAAAGQRPRPCQVDYSGGTGGEQFDDPRQRNLVLRDAVGDREPSAVSRPVMPKAGTLKFNDFSCMACGAWSVAIASTVPSANATRMASRSAAVRNGGFILKLVS